MATFVTVPMPSLGGAAGGTSRVGAGGVTASVVDACGIVGIGAFALALSPGVTGPGVCMFGPAMPRIGEGGMPIPPDGSLSVVPGGYLPAPAAVLNPCCGGVIGIGATNGLRGCCLTPPTGGEIWGSI